MENKKTGNKKTSYKDYCPNVYQGNEPMPLYPCFQTRQASEGGTAAPNTMDGGLYTTPVDIRCNALMLYSNSGAGGVLRVYIYQLEQFSRKARLKAYNLDYTLTGGNEIIPLNYGSNLSEDRCYLYANWPIAILWCKNDGSADFNLASWQGEVIPGITDSNTIGYPYAFKSTIDANTHPSNQLNFADRDIIIPASSTNTLPVARLWNRPETV